MLGMVLTLPLAALLWLGLFAAMPPVSGADDPLARVMFAVGWIAVATLLTVFCGVEAVAHERLVTPAINPLAGQETPRLRINLRFLQNTVEQLLIFAPGLLLVAWYSADGWQMRAVSATAMVWIVLRFAFWIGYHISPDLRTPGLVGMVFGVGALIYGVARFGFELAGPLGAAVPLVLLGMIEVALIWMGRRAGTLHR